MPVFEIRLTGFEFPSGLPGNKANFRFLAALRYLDSKGVFRTQNMILPGADIYWECDPGKRESADHAALYVRDAERPRFDMARVGDWNSLLTLLEARRLHSIQFKVFDVDRRNAWDILQEAAGEFFGSFLSRASRLVPPAVGRHAGGSLGSASDDLEAALISKLSGGSRLLVQGALGLDAAGNAGKKDFQINEPGHSGEYTIEFTVRTES